MTNNWYNKTTSFISENCRSLNTAVLLQNTLFLFKTLLQTLCFFLQTFYTPVCKFPSYIHAAAYFKKNPALLCITERTLSLLKKKKKNLHTMLCFLHYRIDSERERVCKKKKTELTYFMCRERKNCIRELKIIKLKSYQHSN